MSATASHSKFRFSHRFALAGLAAMLSACGSSRPSGSGATAGAPGASGTAGMAASIAGDGGAGGTSPTTAGSGGAAVSAETMHDYAADDPNIWYSGRIDFETPSSPEFSAPGAL